MSDDFDELMDLEDEIEIDEKKVSRKKKTVETEEEEFVEEDEAEHPSPPRIKKQKTKQPARENSKKSKSKLAAAIIGTGFIILSGTYLTMIMGGHKNEMSQPAPVYQPEPPMVVTQPREVAQPATKSPQPESPPVPIENPQQVEIENQGMGENPGSALAGGTVDLENQRIQAAVNEATRELAKQVIEMSVRVNELQDKLQEALAKDSCDTDAIVSQLHEKMENNKTTKATPVKTAPVIKKAESKPSVVKKETKNNLNWKLLGLSSDRAVILSNNGEQIVVMEGDKVDGATITKIDVSKGVVTTTKGIIQ